MIMWVIKLDIKKKGQGNGGMVCLFLGFLNFLVHIALLACRLFFNVQSRVNLTNLIALI